MNTAEKRLVVTAAVLFGTLLFRLGDAAIPVQAGEKQAVDGDNRQTQGVVVATTYFSVKLKSEEDGLVTFFVPENDKQAKEKVGHLIRGDDATIVWERKDRRKWVRDVIRDEGRGRNRLTHGVVVTTTYFSVKLESEQDGLVAFYIPENDKRTKNKVGRLAAGDRVTIVWGLENRRKWVRDVVREGALKGNHQTKGTVVTTTYYSVKLKSEEDGLVTFYIPENDKQSRSKVDQLQPGDRVTIAWGIESRRKWVRDLSSDGSPQQ